MAAAMRVIARRTLREFWDDHPEAEKARRAGYHDVEHSDWRSPIDVRRRYATASILADDRVVFNFHANAYGVVAAINYVEAIPYHLDSLGLSRRDLEPDIGNHARVSEIPNRRRPLTLAMIRRLQAGLGIPADVLIQPYATHAAA